MTEQEIANFCTEHNVTLNFEYDMGVGVTIKMRRGRFFECYLMPREEMSYSLKNTLLRMLHNLNEIISYYDNPQK